MKQGGSTANGAPKGRPMKSRVSCKYCGRSYAMVEQKESHENGCLIYRNGKYRNKKK